MRDNRGKVQDYKKDAVGLLQGEFSGVNDFFFSNYRGLTVEQISEIRSKLREKNAFFKVVKNRFLKIALKNLEQPEVDSFLKGPTAICWTKSESGPATKILFEMSKTMPLEVKGGVVEGTVFDAKKLEEYSKLPTKDELIAILMGTMRAPVQNVVYVLNAVPTKLVRTLAAVAEKKAGN